MLRVSVGRVVCLIWAIAMPGLACAQAANGNIEGSHGKSQVPSSKSQPLPTTNAQAGRTLETPAGTSFWQLVLGVAFGIWKVGVRWDLELGIWELTHVTP